jgi:hypothetical protein
MPYTVTIESYREFAARHGNKPLQVGNRLLFADGAAVVADDESIREEPPADPAENLRQRLAYWRAAVRRATLDFDELKSYCSRQAELATRYSNLPGPPNAALSDLHKLRDAVGFCRDEVAKLEKQLAERTVSDPDRLRRQHLEEYERQQQAAAATVLAEIASINI